MPPAWLKKGSGVRVEVYGTQRKQVMRLIISEGPRFPALAEFYYREGWRAAQGGAS